MSDSASPAPRPVPRPGAPRPTPGGIPTPSALASRPPAPLVPVVAAPAQHDEESLRTALEFGSVREDGTVLVQDGTHSREIGSVAPGSDKEALLPYAHAYLDLAAFLDHSEQRLAASGHTQADLNRLLEQMRKRMREPQVVGDIPALRERASGLRERAKELLHGIEQERAAARDEATRRREALVEEFETIAARDAEQISWKATSQRLREAVPEWKQMQQEGPSLDRAQEEALWERLTAARSSIDRKRREFFSHLEDQHSEAARVKERLIEQAEALQDSTDWGVTVREYRELMQQWRAAPRGQRKKDDAQWARFKAAQDVFFAARNADLAQMAGQQRENLAAKEALLVEAEALVPVKNLERAQNTLRNIQDRWEQIGYVPRGDVRRVEDRLRAVERAIKQAEDDRWRRTDPRTRDRVEGASSQLHAAIAQYEKALEDARVSGDSRRIEEAQRALDARREWLQVIERSARDLG